MLLLKARAGNNDNLETTKRSSLATGSNLNASKQVGIHSAAQSSARGSDERLSSATSGTSETPIVSCRPATGAYGQITESCVYSNSSYYQHQPYHDHLYDHTTNYVGTNNAILASANIADVNENQQQSTGVVRQPNYSSVGYYTSHSTESLNSTIQPHQVMPNSIAANSNTTTIQSVSDSSGGIGFPLAQVNRHQTSGTPNNLVYEALL